MNRVIIPNQWEPRSYQKPLYNQFGHDKKFQRASVIWHRRAGKDSTVLNLTARDMHKRVGTYWHLFPEQAQARKAIWNGIDGQSRRIIDQFLPPEIRSSKSEQEMLIRTTCGSTWQMAGSDNYDSLVGSNPIGVVFSEWALANPAAWDYIRPILRENGGWALFITTPRGRNHAYTTHMTAQTNDSWFDQLLTVDDTGVLTQADIDAERAEGMPESKIQQEFYCSFEAEADDQFIPSEVIALCREMEAAPAVDDPVILGVDVARFGDDKSIIYPRKGRDARTLPIDRYAKMDTMTLASRVAERIEQHKPQAVFIDEGGVGGGVVDRLHQLGFNFVMGVNFGWKSDRRIEGVAQCANKRTEIWATMREALKSGLAIPPDDGLAFELLAPNYGYDSHNALVLEKKDDMKKRGVRSPDIADALALTYAYPVLPRGIEHLIEARQEENYDPIWGNN